jgi:amidase
MIQTTVRHLCRLSFTVCFASVLGTDALGQVPGTAASAAGTAATGSAEFELLEARITDIHAAIEAGELTATELVEGYLGRIKAYNGTCVNEAEGILGPVETIPQAGQINALATLNLRPATLERWGFDARKARSLTDVADDDPAMPDALEAAAALDSHFAATGELVGPLHGVVIAVKDQYDTFDMRTTSGADVDYADDRPPDDATFIARLRDAGAIILAKANLGEYASGIPRSSFGGTFCNPYDTERSPSGSSSGSGSSVAANLVTCAIAEETGSSIRGPARANASVGLAPTQELVSRDGMVQAGINTRVGPICRNVEDVARIMDVIAGYDPKDELTVFSVGRRPDRTYASFTSNRRLDGVTIGVVREYMDKSLFTQADHQTIDLVSRAARDVAALGARVVDPGEGGALFKGCVDRYYPRLGNAIFTGAYPERFAFDAHGEPIGDHVAALVAMTMDPSAVPADLSFRDLGSAEAVGQGKFMMDFYLGERGDDAVKTNRDLIDKARFHEDPNFPDRRERRVQDEAARRYDMSERMLLRFAVRTMVMQCMQEMGLDALLYPTSNIPPNILTAPREPEVNGRGNSWSFLGQQGFPAITVPAGFTTEVYDRAIDPDAPASADGTPGTKLVGPVAAKLPVGVDFVATPYGEPLLFRIASAYEAATRHRVPPPEFGPVDGDL